MFFFLPYATDRPRRRTPWMTYALFTANCLIYLLYELPYWSQGGQGVGPFGFVPAQPELGALVRSMFSHGGPAHLAGNMLFLWLFATLAEDVFGPWLLLGCYLASHIGAILLDMLVTGLSSPGALDTPIVGASGAIAGIMGLSAVCFLRTKVRVWYLVWWGFAFPRTGVMELGTPVFVGLWVVWELLQGMVMAGLGLPSGTAHWAHIGGFAIGLGGALALKLRARVIYADLVEGHRPVTSEFEAFSQAGELEQMVERSPDNADAWHALGRAREASGRLERAGEAYGRALELFLRERRGAQAAEAYAAMKEYQALPALPDAMLFVLACALKDAGRKQDAFRMFQHLVAAGSPGPQTETVLIRAAQIAQDLAGYRVHAIECYERLLKDFPYSSWRGLATEGLAKLRAMPDEAHSVVEEEPLLAGQEQEEPGRPVTRWDRLERRPNERQRPEE